MPTMPRLSSARVFVACRRLACLPPSALHSYASSPARFVRCCVYVRAFVRQCMFVRARSFAALSCPEKLHGPNHVYEELNGYRCNVQQRMTCNVQHTACNIQHVYDLKGSWFHKRTAHSMQRQLSTCAPRIAQPTRARSFAVTAAPCNMTRARCNARCCNAQDATLAVATRTKRQCAVCSHFFEGFQPLLDCIDRHFPK
jgi:hypothetical protein